MNKRNIFLIFCAGFLSAIAVAVLYAFAQKEEPNDTPGTQGAYVCQKVTAVNGVDANRKIDFAGEDVPLDLYDVRERLDRELLVNAYWHSNTIMTIKLANKYFPEIEPILAANNIPDDFKYLCVAESGLRNQVSPSNAVGFWQMLKETAILYGCEVNEEIDQRYSVPLSTQAACKYLKEANGKFGNWTMAAASYNMGMGGLAQQVKMQGQTNYYDLYLNEETSRYLFRILAWKEIITNQQLYGFYLEENDLYEPVPYTTVKLDSSVTNLANYSKQLGTNYKNLKLLNPWMRKTTLTVAKGKNYEVRIPRSSQN